MSVNSLIMMDYAWVKQNSIEYGNGMIMSQLQWKNKWNVKWANEWMIWIVMYIALIEWYREILIPKPEVQNTTGIDLWKGSERKVKIR